MAIGSRVFITSFQLAGVQGLKVESSSDALTQINKITGKNDVGLVLLRDDIAKDIRKELTDLKGKDTRTADLLVTSSGKQEGEGRL